MIVNYPGGRPNPGYSGLGYTKRYPGGYINPGYEGFGQSDLEGLGQFYPFTPSGASDTGGSGLVGSGTAFGPSTEEAFGTSEVPPDTGGGGGGGFWSGVGDFFSKVAGQITSAGVNRGVCEINPYDPRCRGGLAPLPVPRTNYTPWIIGGGVVLLAIVLLKGRRSAPAQ